MAGRANDSARRGVRGTVELTGRGRLFLILIHLTGGAAWLTGEDSARLAFAMLAAPFALDLLWKYLRAPRLAFRLTATRTRAQSAFLETVLVHNESPRWPAFEIAFRDRALVTDAGGGYLHRVEPGATGRLRIGARCRRRGRLRSRTLELASGHPFGLTLWRATAVVDTDLVVEPVRAELPEDVSRVLAGLRNPFESGATRGDEFYALRDHRDGDDARLVHARRSASAGHLVSRMLRGGPDPELLVVLDCRRPPGASPQSAGRRFERGVAIAATVVDHAVADRVRLHFLAIERRSRRWTVDAVDGAVELLDFLAIVRSVPYRAVDAVPELAGAAATVWLSAGGFRDDRAPEGLPELAEALAE